MENKIIISLNLMRIIYTEGNNNNRIMEIKIISLNIPYRIK
jgi:hypothetical protein